MVPIIPIEKLILIVYILTTRPTIIDRSANNS